MKYFNKLGFVAVVAIAVVTTSCGGGESAPELSGPAAEGKELARSSGCTACHGQNGEGSVGPAWVGLSGSVVQLEDGSEVVADRDYLRRSIVEPEADIVAGYTVRMPVVNLSVAEVDALIAYIEALG